MDYAADQKYIAIFVAVGLGIVALSTAWQMEKPVSKTCFASSRLYRVHSDGLDVAEGWAVEGGAFNQCVHRAEAADAAFRKRYSDGRYNLTLASTIGCHAPCDE